MPVSSPDQDGGRRRGQLIFAEENTWISEVKPTLRKNAVHFPDSSKEKFYFRCFSGNYIFNTLHLPLSNLKHLWNPLSKSHLFFMFLYLVLSEIQKNSFHSFPEKSLLVFREHYYFTQAFFLPWDLRKTLDNAFLNSNVPFMSHSNLVTINMVSY